jgi:hypothetical protein
MQVWILVRGSEHLRIRRASLRWQGATLVQIVRTSLGGIGQTLCSPTTRKLSPPAANGSPSCRIPTSSTAGG